ncbi:MAG: plasminogen-binding N-terminal domain-containing protein [Campylobacterota bacterium]|nr:plasminogen-binding N-terminal domain-containing protein [Campylobacterota bacterium]
MKLLLLFLFFISTVVAQTTLCYKKDTASTVLEKTTLLNGGECQGKLSVLNMEKENWELSDTKIVNDNGVFNHIYIFNKETKEDEIASVISSSISDSAPQYRQTVKKMDLRSKQLEIYELSNSKAKIKLGNLKIGQSGVIVHNGSKEDSIIIAVAQVIDTNSNYSTIQIKKKSIVKQDAIPTSKHIASNGDTFILNHIYSSSLLIVPNSKAKALVVLNYPNQKFLSEDFFASYLKVISTPVLNKEDIMNFAQSQQIGTVFIVIKNTLYIKDSITFKTIDKVTLNINDSTTQVPFYSKIEKIEKGLLDFGADKIADYNLYYSSLVNNTTYSNNLSSNNNDDDKTLFQSVKEIFTW